MGVRVYSNFVSTKLTAQLLAAGTTANVTAGDGALFAGANADDWIIGTLRHMSGFKDVAHEIVKITNRSTDALTITRAQESTSALQFEIGDRLDVDFTAASFADTFNLPIAAAGGTVDAITATYSPALTLSNQVVAALVSAGANATTTPTFAPNGLTAHTITTRGGQALTAGEIGPAGFVALLEYNLANTRWELLNPVPAAGSMTNPMTTGGDVIYGGASGAPTRLANGSAGQVLQSAGGTSAPTWATVRDIPQNSQSAAYTTVLADAGKHIFHPSSDVLGSPPAAQARTFTIDSNANVAFPVGTAITFVNQGAAGTLTIAITADTMRLAGTGTTGSRTLAADGIATALKVASTEWLISGTGLT